MHILNACSTLHNLPDKPMTDPRRAEGLALQSAAEPLEVVAKPLAEQEDVLSCIQQVYWYKALDVAGVRDSLRNYCAF